VADEKNAKPNKFHKSLNKGQVNSRRKTMSTIKNLIMNEDGATALEYGLLAALIAVAIIGAVGVLGSTVSNTFSTIATQMTNAMNQQ
jgi:pilus assembly protein Flp/PilA